MRWRSPTGYVHSGVSQQPRCDRRRPPSPNCRRHSFEDLHASSNPGREARIAGFNLAEHDRLFDFVERIEPLDERAHQASMVMPRISHTRSSCCLGSGASWTLTSIKLLALGCFFARAMIAAIQSYIDAHNANPKPFIWTAGVEAILEKIRRAVLNNVPSE